MKQLLALTALLFAAGAQAQSYYNPPQSNGYYNNPQPSYNAPRPAPQQNYGYNPPSHDVNGYVKNDGTYVAPHQQTMPDATKANNYNTPGNYNPNTGQYTR